MRLTSKFTGIADKDEMAAVGARILEEMDVCSPHVRDYEANGTIYLFKSFEGERIHPNSPLYEKLKTLEKKLDCKVYAVTYEQFSWGRVYTFLLVSKYREDWSVMFRETGDPYKYIAYAYCWNLDREDYSEPGSVILESGIGGIRRVG